MARLRAESSFFRRNEETIVAIVNLAVFLFITTGIVYETQHWRFTVTALTTTGFGDIVLEGSTGRSSP